MTFGVSDLRQLSGTPLEKQVVNVLVKHGAPLERSALHPLLQPKPTTAAFDTLITHMLNAKEIVLIPEKGIGLPGWALKVAKRDVDQAMSTVSIRPEVVPTAPQPPEEPQMPKKRAPRISAEAANTAVETLLGNAAIPLTAEQIASDAELSIAVVTKALKRLKSSGHAAPTGRGTAATWSKAKKLAGGNAAAPAAAPAKTDLARRFGYFSDGSVSIDCDQCKGTLTVADLKAFHAFSDRFEESAP